MLTENGLTDAVLAALYNSDAPYRGASIVLFV
jgi:hypothetical protein